MTVIRAVAVVLFVSGCASAPSTTNASTSQHGAQAEYLSPHGPSTLPFSAGVRVGDVIYLSGQIGNRRGDSSGVVPGGIEAETRQALDNIKAILEASGSSMDRIVKCTVMLADMTEWPAMNAVYATYFPDHKPARSAFGATALALGARVEIECWALARR
jgi:reactive intermediate/imine deaminase